MTDYSEVPNGLLDRTASILNSAAGIILGAGMIQITLDVLARYAFSSPLFGTIGIISAYHMVMMTAFPLAFLQLRNRHIRVELVNSVLSPRGIHILDRINAGIMVAFFAGISWINAEEALHRTMIGEVWQASTGLLIVWPSRWVLTLGFLMLALASLATMLRPRQFHTVN